MLCPTPYLNTSPILPNIHRSHQTTSTMKISSITITFTLLFSILFIISSTLTLAARHPGNNNNNNNNNGGVGGFFGQPGFNIPGFGPGGNFGGGYGGGYGGPSGGYGKGGVVRPTVVCRDKGPCYKKKITCPARCYKSFSRSGKGYGGGGGSGSCTVDCKRKCTASC